MQREQEEALKRDIINNHTPNRLVRQDSDDQSNFSIK